MIGMLPVPVMSGAIPICGRGSSMLVKPKGESLVLLLAITSKEPRAGRSAIEIPEIEKRRANLDIAQPLWIILDERNEDTLPTSCYFEPDARIGMFSATFLKRIQRAKIDAIKSRKSRKVARKD